MSSDHMGNKGAFGMHAGWLAVAAALAGGCATAARPLTSGAPQPGEGVLVGRLALPHENPTSQFPATLTFQRADDGRRFDVALRWDRSRDGGGSTPFAVSLPAGRYRVTSWQIYDGDCVARGTDLGVDVEVAAARNQCLGTIYFGWGKDGDATFAHAPACTGAAPPTSQWTTSGRAYAAGGSIPGLDSGQPDRNSSERLATTCGPNKLHDGYVVWLASPPPMTAGAPAVRTSPPRIELTKP